MSVVSISAEQMNRIKIEQLEARVAELERRAAVPSESSQVIHEPYNWTSAELERQLVALTERLNAMEAGK